LGLPLLQARQAMKQQASGGDAADRSPPSPMAPALFN
jgi:hypothetical protein